MSIETVLRAHESELLALPGVTSVGIGDEQGKEVILLFVSRQRVDAAAAGQGGIPATLEGYEVVVRPELLIGGTGSIE
jgi:hypothetical protein